MQTPLLSSSWIPGTGLHSWALQCVAASGTHVSLGLGSLKGLHFVGGGGSGISLRVRNELKGIPMKQKSGFTILAD